MRIKRAIDISMANREGIIGSCAFNYEDKVAYHAENMILNETDLVSILNAWNEQASDFLAKNVKSLLMCQKNLGS